MRHFVCAAIIVLTAGLAGAQDSPVAGSIRIEGDGIRPRTVSLDELRKSTDATTADWTDDGKAYNVRGVPLERLLALQPETTSTATSKSDLMAELKSAVVVTAKDGYQTVFSSGELMSELSCARVLLVYEVDGKPLPPKMAPARVVVLSDTNHDRGVWAVDRITVLDLRKHVPAKP